ncbi:asparagine synthase (glutamine-hydrolyzing) [Catenulispora rubra]|uniref:asparagine synthase (glutamine-hydrolyzing) n=1 Tax=Catenulispora rubra TaxID=280293 RepID=UPI0018921812|nr:asparagine synthase (glutamine-hydrolyzing) [Catenulispora rubra]
MCGITGWISYERDLRNEAPTLDAMTATMECRGPDDRGTWIDGPAALGHRRLAIIDLPGGRQPMAVEAGGQSVVIVYSGETYNFTELRAELASRGHRFTTDSDTEVVLRGYLEWGSAVAERLNGMYAFAIWDGRDRKLRLIRDRMGIKPLYYSPIPDGVLFGSEPKAILANPLAERSVGLDGLRELFVMVKTPGHAFWSGMREVEPGTVVTIGPEGIRTDVYWTLATREHADSQGESIAHVRELLDDIVRRQLVADVPRCVLLSGGLDSSTLTALSARQLAVTGEKIRSFAVDFVDQAKNFVPDPIRADPDTPFVHAVAEHSNTVHQDIVLDAESLTDLDARRTVIRARDMPAGLGDMDTSLYLLFKEIRDHSTVALSGESADEVFGGYQDFFDEDARRGGTFPWLVKYTENFGDDMGLLRPELRQAMDLQNYVQECYDTAVSTIERLPGESDFEYRMRRVCHLYLTRFVRFLLDRKDRLSMAVGLEVRVPFCDHRLVEYVYNAPWSIKSFDGREKSLLREAAADVLPRSVYDRVKSPYPSTQDPRYVIALRSRVADLLSQPSHAVFDFVDPATVRRLVDDTGSGIMQASRRGLERTLDMALWLEMYRPTLSWS